jgi:hypothetical protein
LCGKIFYAPSLCASSGISIERDESGLDGVVGETHAIAYLELLKNFVEMRFDRTFCDRQMFGNLRVAEAARDASHNFVLARSEASRWETLLHCELGL